MDNGVASVTKHFFQEATAAFEKCSDIQMKKRKKWKRLKVRSSLLSRFNEVSRSEKKARRLKAGKKDLVMLIFHLIKDWITQKWQTDQGCQNFKFQLKNGY